MQLTSIFSRIKLPMLLLFMITAVLFLGNFIPLYLKEISYSISLSLKNVLEFFLPLIIFSYLASCIMSFKKGVIVFISILLIIVFLSNFFGSLVSYGSFLLVFNKIGILSNTAISSTSDSLSPVWSFRLPKLISNDSALFLSLLLSISINFIRSFAEKYRINNLLIVTQFFEKLVNILKRIANIFLRRFFIPLVPLFILGYVISLQYSGSLNQIINSYLPVFLLVISIQALYLTLIFLVITKFNINLSFLYMRNTFPAALAGFGTMSSEAAMPLTLIAAEKNTNNPAIAHVLIPATLNIHMVGNSIAMPIMAISCLLTFDMPFPDFQSFVFFGLSFALAQFAVSAVPSGGIFIMIPLMEKFLGFTPEMISLITTLNILLDPPVTATSIFGNSALAIFLNNLFTKIKIVPEKS